MAEEIDLLGPRRARRLGAHERFRYEFKTTPYPHQRAALKKLLSTGWGGALLMEPRTGKTKVGIDWVSVLHQAGKVDRVLVVCPVSVMGVWVREIRMHCPVPHRVFVWDKKTRKKGYTLPKWGSGKLDFVIVNYDAFSTPGKMVERLDKNTGEMVKVRTRRGGRFENIKQFRAWAPHAIILDESHRVKSPSASKTRALRGVVWDIDQKQNIRGCRIPYRVIATGTPVTKKKRIFDVYSQWKILNPRNKLVSHRDLAQFKEDFSVWTERRGYPQWLRNKNQKWFRQLLHEDSYAITRAEAFPGLTRLPDTIVPVELTGHTAEVYDEMAEEMVAQLKSGELTEASATIVKAMRLMQITSGIARTNPTDEHPNGRLVRIGRDKLEALEDRLEDLFEADEKVVIGAQFRADIASILVMLRKHKGWKKIPGFQLHGGIPRAQRDKDREMFQTHEGPALFVMQPAAGSLGIDLSSASIMIWYSMGRSWVDFTQAEDRIALSTRPTAYEYIIASPIDQLIYDTHQEDGDVGRAVLQRPDALLRERGD